MNRAVPSRPSVPASFFAKLMLPFALPILLTFALLIVVGDRWPRDIAPGSGLKLAGLMASAFTAAAVWHFMVRGQPDTRVRKFAALACLVTGLMGWPVWSVGLLPSANGAALGAERSVQMVLDRTETTTRSKSRALNYWAWLKPGAEDAPLQSGRYFIPQARHDDWSQRRPATVEVTYAEGALGAVVITGYR